MNNDKNIYERGLSYLSQKEQKIQINKIQQHLEQK